MYPKISAYSPKNQSYFPKSSLVSGKLKRKKYFAVRVYFMYHVTNYYYSTSEKSHGMWRTQDIFLMPIMERNLMV